MLFPRKSPAFSIQIRKNLPFLAVFILLCLVFAACDSATSSSISPSAAFTVTFNANGATGGSVSTSMMVVRLGSTITLPGQGTLVKSGAAFGGWNTNAAGTGTNYSAGELYTVTGDVTLYANWGTGSATAYTVTFNANSATRGTAPPAMTASSGSIITLPGQGMLERTNFTFGGWNTSAAGIGTNYNAGSSYTVTGNITLYARWFAPDTYYTVSFNGNSATGGTEPPAMTAIAGSDITLPGQGTLEKNGAIFGGWNTTASGIGVNYNAGSSFTVAGNTSLYAKWGPIPVSGIEGVPATAIAGTALPLIGTVLPENATNKTIVWSVKDAGGTGATISGGLLNTTGGGTVTVTARIAYGTDQVTAYTQDFAITVLQNVLGDRFEYYWVDSHDSLVTTSGGETTVAVGRTLVITALSTGYIVKQWHLNGVDTGQRGNSYSFSSATTGNYTVGLFVEKDGKLYNTTIVITVELRIVVIDMYDSGGNGWDGNGALRINVNGVQKAADIKVQTTAANNNPSGQRYTNTYTFTVATGDFVQLDWVSGTNQGENSFIAYYADMPPIPSFAESDQTAWIGTNALVYRLRNTMNSIANNDPLGSFSVPDSETVPVITINTQPAAATSVMEGIITGNLSVSAGVTQGAEISYQWYRSNSSSGTGITVLSGETSTDFSIPVTLTAGRYYYFCEARAKGAVSVRSGLATVMVMVTGEANLTD
ncbi:MAG: InlB B-repeat-containing protein, partial [Treponema sp.]|nr:InlB B-repeat-containing protein [Treponema sp.]